MAAQDDINVIIIKHDESPIEVYSDDDILVLRGLRHARKTFTIPRFFINLAHQFRVKLNPIYADENYDTDIFTTTPQELHYQRQISLLMSTTPILENFISPT